MVAAGEPTGELESVEAEQAEFTEEVGAVERGNMSANEAAASSTRKAP